MGAAMPVNRIVPTARGKAALVGAVIALRVAHASDPLLPLHEEVRAALAAPRLFAQTGFTWPARKIRIGIVGGTCFDVPRGHAYYDRIAEATTRNEVEGYHDELTGAFA